METYKIKKTAYIFGIFFILMYLIFQYNQYTKFLGMVPKEINVSYFFTFGTRDFGACGAAIFTLSDETYNSIVKDELLFLNTANKTREFYKNRYASRPSIQDTYESWVKTDQSDKYYWSADAAFGGLYCYGSGQITATTEEIRKNIIESGSYYTRIKYDAAHGDLDGSRLLIVPSMKIAIIEYWGY